MPIPLLDPNLRAGWEPETPSSDSILRAFLTNWSDLTAREVELHGGQALRRDDLVAYDLGRPGGFTNIAFLLAPLFLEGARDVIDALDAFFDFEGSRKSGEVMIFSPWLTPDLRPHGWNLMGHPPFMLRAAGGELPPAPEGLRIERVRDAAALVAAEQVIIRGFSEMELGEVTPGDLFAPALLDDDQMRFWIGWEGEAPVSMAMVRVADGINHVHIVATVPEARHRGYGKALTWRATLADPSLPAVLIASDDGRPVYEKMGYLSVFRFTGWWRPRTGRA